MELNKKYYGEDNINNIASCEIRGIVDDYIIDLWCKKKATKLSKKKEFYLSIDKHEFDFNVNTHITKIQILVKY